MGAPVVHWEINAKDGKRAQEFYSGLFGWKVDANNPMNYGMVDTSVKMGINGGIGQVKPGEPSSTIFYVQVEDLPGCLSNVERLGGRVVVPTTEVPGVVTFAVFADPEGNTVGLVKGPQTPPKKAAAPRKAAKKAKAKPKAKARKPKRKKR